MQASTLVVLLTLGVAVRGSLLAPLVLAQPAHHPAVVLDPHGRPLDTAEVISARALHLTAKALEHHAPVVAAPLAHAYAAPLLGAHSVYGVAAHGHYLGKRSLGHLAYGAPLVYSALAPAAVSHQSRVDVHSAPAVLAHSVLAPAPGFYSAIGYGAHGHLLKKRSLGHLAYAGPLALAPSAVSHQARVDVISSPAVVSHAVAAPAVVAAPVAVSHQSRVDVRSSPALAAHAAWPVAALHAAPYAHAGLLHASPLLHHAW